MTQIGTKNDLCKEFENAGAVCSIVESSWPQNPRVPIVLRTSKSAGARLDVWKFHECHARHPRRGTRANTSPVIKSLSPFCRVSRLASSTYFKRMNLLEGCTKNLCVLRRSSVKTLRERRTELVSLGPIKITQSPHTIYGKARKHSSLCRQTQVNFSTGYSRSIINTKNYLCLLHSSMYMQVSLTINLFVTSKKRNHEFTNSQI